MTNENTIRKFKWFCAWQDEQEEEWLSKMAMEGWHLEKLGFPPGVYHFRKGAPAEVVYRLDYQALGKKDRDSYLQLFADAGWEHAGDMVGWVYFRKEVKPSEELEIYSDAESKTKKYQRILLFLLIFFPILIVLIPEAGEDPGLAFQILKGLMFLLLLLYAYAMVKLMQRIDQLRKSSSE